MYEYQMNLYHFQETKLDLTVVFVMNLNITLTFQTLDNHLYVKAIYLLEKERGHKSLSEVL